MKGGRDVTVTVRALETQYYTMKKAWKVFAVMIGRVSSRSCGKMEALRGLHRAGVAPSSRLFFSGLGGTLVCSHAPRLPSLGARGVIHCLRLVTVTFRLPVTTKAVPQSPGILGSHYHSPGISQSSQRSGSFASPPDTSYPSP
ncbi:hypothetical protein E2C01_038413 [Portunus trituberculatus]|uniref:Uncharacterized protein n=1 Tax=Portunus trituberculatus TaxID=210409 RepID=A0A5B7FK35_PORTR|nr:hypothetical protein [Portunus trituberculatus]